MKPGGPSDLAKAKHIPYMLGYTHAFTGRRRCSPINDTPAMTPSCMATLLARGRLRLVLANRQSPVAACENLVAGTLEYFPYDFAAINRIRLFDLYCEDAASVKRVPFHALTDIRTQHELGCRKPNRCRQDSFLRRRV